MKSQNSNNPKWFYIVWISISFWIFCALFPSVNACSISMSCASQYGKQIDVVILVDIDGPFANNAGVPKAKKCQKQQEMVADTICMLKGSQHNGDGLPSARVAYIEFDRNRVNTLYGLNNNEINGATEISNQQMIEFTDFVESRCDDVTDDDLNVAEKQCNQNTKLYDALQVAATEIAQRTNALGRDAYIIIFSDCKVTAVEQERICNNFDNVLKSNSIKVVMMNMGREFESNTGDYILCLAENDNKRIYQSQSRDYVDFVENGLEKTIINQVCYQSSTASSANYGFNNFQMEQLFNNNDENMFNDQLIVLNVCISAITCLIVIGLCLCIYYFMKQMKSTKYVQI